ncbi:MAG: hypothetical protein QOH46_1737, partial [Solirubrobacteraceae bacterium]|nr:hypothetical protein [Solirubrobacteraceae bacterium]
LRATAEEMLRDADIALYEAKESGKDRYVLFAPRTHAIIEQRLKATGPIAASAPVSA